MNTNVEELLKLDPNQLELIIEIVRRDIKARRIGEAEDLLELLAFVFPMRPEVHLARAEYEKSKGNLAAAEVAEEVASWFQ